MIPLVIGFIVPLSIIAQPQFPNILISPGDGIYRPNIGVTVNLTEFPGTKPGTSVANFHAFSTSPAAPNGYEYFIVPSTNPQKLFSIDPHGGLLTVTGELDRESKEFHVIRVGAMDPDRQVGYTAITIFINDLNDNSPELLVVGKPEIAENQPIGTTIATLLATDRDGPDNSGPFQFELVSGSDKVTLVPDESLDKGNGGAELRSAVVFDYESGPTSFEVSVRVTDNGAPPLSSLQTVVVSVLDVNDITPEIRLLKSPSILENEPAGTVVTTIVGFDPEAAPNSGPFTFELATVNVPFELTYVAALDNGMGGAHLRSKIPFDFESGVTKYPISVKISDSGNPSLSGTYEVIVEILDVNDDKMVDTDMQIQIVTLDGELSRSYIGSAQVAVDSTAGFNPVDKIFEWVGNQPEGFSLDLTTGRLYVGANPSPGTHRFTVKVSDAKTGDSAYSSVLVKISDISSNDIWSSTLVRITGISATNFIQLQPDQLNLISRFSARLAHIFSVNMTEVKIASVVPGDLHIDIFYAVRNGTGHFAPLLLDTILTLSRRTLETELSADVKLIGLQTCVTHGCPGRCENFVTVGKRMSVIERIGRSTLITPTATASARCHTCKPIKSDTCEKDSCANGGVCYNTDIGHYCHCGLPSLQGPECQFRTASFSGDGYILASPLAFCGDFHLSLDFITSKADGMLLYAGPVSFTGFSANHNRQFFALLLIRGRAVLTFNFGLSQITVQLPNESDNLSDGRWHSIDIFIGQKKLELVVDRCRSISNLTSCRTVLEDVRGENTVGVSSPLLIGGLIRSGSFDYPAVVADSPDFSGCLEDLLVNGETVDFKNVLHEANSSLSCPTNQYRCSYQTCYRGKCRADELGFTTCQCEPGWTGASCDQKSTWTYFNGDSFVKYLLHPENDAMEFHRDFQLLFAPMSANGTMLQFQNAEKQMETRVELEEFNFKFSSSTPGYSGVNSFIGFPVKRYQPYRVAYRQSGRNRVWVSLDSHRYQFNDEVEFVDDQDYPPMIEAIVGAESAQTEFNYEGCMADLRWNGVSMATDPQTVTATSKYEVVGYANLLRGCPALATCETSPPDFCRFPLECFDIWKGPICVCQRGFRPILNNLGQLKFCEEISPGNLLALLASGAGIALLLFILACVVLFLVAATLLYQRQTSRSTSEKSVEKIVNYCEEGGGEADQGGFDVVTLRKPIVTASISSDGEMEERAVDIGELTSEKVETTTSAEIPQHSASDLQELGQFISARLAETQVDPIAPPYDEIRPYEFEGDGVSGGGSLSSLSTTEDNDADLNQAVPTWGPKFAGLAQICEGSDSD